MQPTDGELFRALMRCPRIKMQGSAGVDPHTGELKYPEHPGSVHFGAEFWTTGEPQNDVSTVWGRHALRALAMDILAAEAIRKA